MAKREACAARCARASATVAANLAVSARISMFRVYHGKHNGSTFQDVIENDRSYVSWVLRCDSLPSSLKMLKQYVLEKNGGIMTVGKYRGRYFSEVGACSLTNMLLLNALLATGARNRPGVLHLDIDSP